MKEAYSSCGLTRAQYAPILYVLQLLSFALFFIVPCRVVLLQKTGSKQITKKGNHQHPSNYKPIFLTSIVSKLAI